jgi:hypothetical protein
MAAQLKSPANRAGRKRIHATSDDLITNLTQSFAQVAISNNSNSDSGLCKSLQRTLVADIVSEGGPQRVDVRTICNLRPHIYGKPASVQRRKVQNRIHKYKQWSEAKWNLFVTEAHHKIGFFQGVEYSESPNAGHILELSFNNSVPSPSSQQIRYSTTTEAIVLSRKPSNLPYSPMSNYTPTKKATMASPIGSPMPKMYIPETSDYRK